MSERSMSASPASGRPTSLEDVTERAHNAHDTHLETHANMARLISAVLAPVPLTVALPVVVGWLDAGVAGAAWGLVPAGAGALAAGYGWAAAATRALLSELLPRPHHIRLRPRHVDHDPDGGKSPGQLLTACVLTLLGLAVLVLGDAPRTTLLINVALLGIAVGIGLTAHAVGAAQRLAYCLGSVAYLVLPVHAPGSTVPRLVPSLRWDVSVHTATAAGATVMIDYALHPDWSTRLFMLGCLLALIWARTVPLAASQKAPHTLAQAITGAAVGVAATWLVHQLIP